MAKLLKLVCFSLLALTVVGCGRKEAQTAACIANMKQLQTAAELYVTQKGKQNSTPTLKDLCGGPDKFIKVDLTCPKDGSHYQISRGVDGFEIKCGSGDPEHVLP